MRIVVCQRVCPEYIIPLFERLNRRYDIEFVFSLFGQEPGFFFNPARLGGIRARRVRPLSFPLLPFRSRPANKLSYWLHTLVLGRRLAAELRGYDVLVGGDFGRFETATTYLAACRDGRPFGLWSDEWRWPRGWRQCAWAPFVRMMIRRADVLIAGGSLAQAKLRELGGADKPIFNIYHTNISARPLATREATGQRFVLYVGRLDERKGVEYLVRALRAVRLRMPDVRLKIIGRGVLREPLERLVGDLGLTAAVDFVGWVDHDEVEQYYRRCAVFVLPSIFTSEGGYEPFSNVVLEAMACSAPVITTTANGVSYDVIENGVNGVVVPDRDVDALATALVRLLEDPDRAENIGRHGWETIRDRFNVDRMADGFGEALDCLIRRRTSVYA